MGSRSSPDGHLGVSLILFTLSALMAILLFVAAFTVWLSELTHSLFVAMLIVGSFFLTVALMSYLLSLRYALRRINDRLETIYDVAESAKRAYEWALEMLKRVL